MRLRPFTLDASESRCEAKMPRIMARMASKYLGPRSRSTTVSMYSSVWYTRVEITAISCSSSRLQVAEFGIALHAVQMSGTTAFKPGAWWGLGATAHISTRVHNFKDSVDAIYDSLEQTIVHEEAEVTSQDGVMFRGKPPFSLENKYRAKRFNVILEIKTNLEGRLSQGSDSAGINSSYEGRL